MNASHHTPTPWPFAALTPLQHRQRIQAQACLQRRLASQQAAAVQHCIEAARQPAAAAPNTTHRGQP